MKIGILHISMQFNWEILKYYLIKDLSSPKSEINIFDIYRTTEINIFDKYELGKEVWQDILSLCES